MANNNLVSDAACNKFISALKEDKDRTTDLVFDDMQKSKAFVMSQIPDGGVVDYNDNNDTIEYTAAMQAHRQYRDIDADPRDLVAGKMEGRDENGQTGLFETQVNEIDENACSGTCRFRFGQGFKTYTTRDYELPMSTDVVCARDYIRKGRAHVDGDDKRAREVEPGFSACASEAPYRCGAGRVASDATEPHRHALSGGSFWHCAVFAHCDGHGP